MTSENNKLIVPVTALVGATVGAGTMFIINEMIKAQYPYYFGTYLHNQPLLCHTGNQPTNQRPLVKNNTNGITITTNGFNKFIPDNEFQSFFELSVSRGHVNDYSILEYAIRRDYNNLQHFRDNELIFLFVKIALDQDIRSLEYCERISNQIVLNKVINYAKELYGDSIYDYIERPEGEDNQESNIE